MKKIYFLLLLLSLIAIDYVVAVAASTNSVVAVAVTHTLLATVEVEIFRGQKLFNFAFESLIEAVAAA